VQPLAGTGFLVGEGLVMTNRHVAEVFARGLDTSTPKLRPGMAPVIDFGRERTSRPGDTRGRYKIEAVLAVRTDWDIALLRLDRTPAGIAPLELARTLPGGVGREIAVLGYPGRPDDPRTVERDIFHDIYDVKRVSPGQLGDFEKLDRTNLKVLTHDGSTLPGSSGSPVLDVQTGHVIGVHFDGEDLHANYLVPSDALAHERALVAAGVQFTA
jgi:endonuclease G